MEINTLTICSNRINEQEGFYKDILGFHCSRTTEAELEIKVGSTELILEKSNDSFFYHFAFLIPTGSLDAAINYVEHKSIQLLPLDGEKIIQFDEGRSIYFYDEDGNIVEFIERPTLNYASSDSFSPDDIIKVNEIGLPVSDPLKMTDRLIAEFGIMPIHDAPANDMFCWVGDYNGAIIVAKEGRNWLPTKKPGKVNDFSIRYTDRGKGHNLTFINNEIKNG